MSYNSVESAKKYAGELDKVLVQKAVTGFFTDNALRAKFVGAKDVVVSDIDFLGLADYDRDTGSHTRHTHFQKTGQEALKLTARTKTRPVLIILPVRSWVNMLEQRSFPKWTLMFSQSSPALQTQEGTR